MMPVSTRCPSWILLPRSLAWLILALACWLPSAGATEASVAFEKPFYDAALWTPDVGARTSVCSRQQQVHQGNISVRDALNGLSLSVVFDDYAPYTILDDSGAVTGPK